MVHELDWVSITTLGGSWEVELNLRTNQTRYRKFHIPSSVPFSTDTDPIPEEPWIYGEPPKEKEHG